MLARQVQQTVDALEGAGLQSSTVPWSNQSIPAPFHQSKVVRRLSSKFRERKLAAMDALAAARWRSCSGAGSSGFPLTPLSPTTPVENILFRIAVAKRMGGGVQAGSQSNPAPQCCHMGRNGACTHILDPEGVHADICPMGGYIVRAHNRLSCWLADWLKQSRAASEVHMELKLSAPEGRMDVVVGHGSDQDWIDVAIVSPSSTCSRTLQSRAKKDGSGARAEEGIQRRRYGSRVSPFVIESGGRPGASARAILMRYALDDPTISADVGTAWRAISCLVQSDRALAVLTAWGGSRALESGRARIFIP